MWTENHDFGIIKEGLEIPTYTYKGHTQGTTGSSAIHETKWQLFAKIQLIISTLIQHATLFKYMH